MILHSSQVPGFARSSQGDHTKTQDNIFHSGRGEGNCTENAPAKPFDREVTSLTTNLHLLKAVSLS